MGSESEGRHKGGSGTESGNDSSSAISSSFKVAGQVCRVTIEELGRNGFTSNFADTKASVEASNNLGLGFGDGR